MTDARKAMMSEDPNEGGEDLFPMPSLTQKLKQLSNGHRGQHNYCGCCTYAEALARISLLEKALYRSDQKALRFRKALESIREYPHGWQDHPSIHDYIGEALRG